MKRNQGKHRGKWQLPLIMIVCYFGIFLYSNFFGGGSWNKVDKLKIVNQARSGADVSRHVGAAGDPGHEDVVILNLPLLLTVDVTSGYLYSEDDSCEVQRVMLNEGTDVEPIRGNWYRVEVVYAG